VSPREGADERAQHPVARTRGQPDPSTSAPVPFGYKINRHDMGEGARRRYRIIGEEIEAAEAEAIKEADARVLRGESIRSIAFDFNDRGIRAVGAAGGQGRHCAACWSH
jgi:hypothetical protein